MKTIAPGDETLTLTIAGGESLTEWNLTTFLAGPV